MICVSGLLSWSPLDNTVGVRRLGRPLRDWLARHAATWFDSSLRRAALISLRGLPKRRVSSAGWISDGVGREACVAVGGARGPRAEWFTEHAGLSPPRRLHAEWFTEHADLSSHAGCVLHGIARMNPAEQTG